MTFPRHYLAQPFRGLHQGHHGRHEQGREGSRTPK